MSRCRDIIFGLAVDDMKIRRQIGYWAATVVLYSICAALLWLEIHADSPDARLAAWLTAGIVSGLAVFYALIRSSKRLQLQPAQLALYQGNFAIVCITAAYTIVGPARGAVLAILLVVLVFCAFALTPDRSRRMSVFAIVLLGAAMTAMVGRDPVRFKPQLEATHFLLAATMLLVVAYLTGELSKLRAHLKAQNDELADALSRIQTLATRDELTSLANRRYMTEILADEERRRKMQGQPVCIALIDIDLFKQINDTYGHAAGDKVLCAFARQAQAVLRNSDVLARWGGEEFLLLLPDTDLPSARLVIERLKEQLAALDFSAIVPGRRVTFSSGLVALPPDESTEEGISRADHAMYRAKAAGRDCIVVG